MNIDILMETKMPVSIKLPTTATPALQKREDVWFYYI